MKCFECKEQIKDDRNSIHVGDGDFVHKECYKKHENSKAEFFKNVHNNQWFEKWLYERLKQSGGGMQVQRVIVCTYLADAKIELVRKNY